MAQTSPCLRIPKERLAHFQAKGHTSFVATFAVNRQTHVVEVYVFDQEIEKFINTTPGVERRLNQNERAQLIKGARWERENQPGFGIADPAHPLGWTPKELESQPF